MDEILRKLESIEILQRVNNMLMSKFILELSNFKKKYKVKDTISYFRFEIERWQYDELVAEFSLDTVDRALVRLDSLLLENKQQCPSNVYKYIRSNCNRNKRRKANGK